MRRWHAAEGSDNFLGGIHEQGTETMTGMVVITRLLLMQKGSNPEWDLHPECPGVQEPETVR